MIEIVAEFPEKLGFLFEPARYKVAHGGRGGAKSWGFARALLILAAQKRMRVLCARELQLSIADSVHKLLKEQIEALGLGQFYTVLESVIRGSNGSEFIFSGLKSNSTKIKSMEGLDVCWVEEAQKVSADSWKDLIPTVRKEASEIWVSFNPDQEGDPTYQRFIKNQPPGAVVVQIGWQDNPWLPDVLREEKDYLYRVDPEAAAHVWGGKTWRITNAQVLRGRYVVESFEPVTEGRSAWSGPHYGADWGFATDPTTLIRCWVDNRTLYIEHEAYGVGVDIEDTPELFDHVPGAKEHTIRADSARPETISHMRRHGYGRMLGCTKWQGSVEDGVEHLRSYERIVIHPRCPRAAEEARLWSYKTDRLTGDVLPVLADRHDHCLIGDTLVDTAAGPTPIADLVGSSGILATGERFHSVRMTSPAENVYTVRFGDGSAVVATSEHMFMTMTGWRPVAALTPGTRVVDISHELRYGVESCDQERYRNSTASRSSLTRSAATTSRSFPCISTHGTGCAGQSPRGCMSTILTGTRPTTALRISSCSAPPTTGATTGSMTASASSRVSGATSRRPVRLPANGTARRPGEHGTSSRVSALPPASSSKMPAAISAVAGIEASSRDGFAQTLASLLLGESPALISFKANALSVEVVSAPTRTVQQKRAAGHAEPCSRTVVAVEPSGVAPVYNLEVDGSHTFTVCGGLVTHNCWDAVRYALEPIIRAGKPRKKPPPAPPRRRDYNEPDTTDSYKTV